GEDQPAVRPRSRCERRGETGLGEREADADVAALLIAVCRVDTDIDGFVIVGERPDPAPHRHDVLAGSGDRVDAAADAALGLALVHRYARLAQRSCEQVAVQQVAGTYPQAPFGHDVEREP